MPIDARLIPEAVQWHEGMLLSPQHFQLAARRTEALAAYLMGLAAPLCWGVQRLQIDQSLLLEGVFRVVELEAVMPDGLPVLYPAGDDDPRLELDFKETEIDPRVTPVTVHVAVAARSEHANLGGLMRYRSVEGSPVLDDNTGDNALAVPRLRPAPSLHLMASPLQGPSSKYVSLPLARIAYRDETYVLDSFEPPRTALTRDTMLYRCARRVAVQLREKALALGESLQSVRLQGNDAHTPAIGAQLSSVVRTLPRLEALLDSGVAHPFQVYLALCDVVGDVAVIGGQLNLPQLSGYEHRDPLPPFSEIALHIERVLALLRETFRSVRFTRLEPGRFALAMRPGWVTKTPIIGARIGPGQSADAVRDWMETALIASSSRMRNIRENRVRGAARDVVAEAAELELVASPNVLLHRILAEDFAIVPEDTLEVAGAAEDPGHGQPLELVLYLPARLVAGDASSGP
jgi:type VI secretion system protein ImpJ